MREVARFIVCSSVLAACSATVTPANLLDGQSPDDLADLGTVLPDLAPSEADLALATPDLADPVDLAIASGPETQLAYTHCTNSPVTTVGFNGFSAVQLEPPSRPFFIDAIEFNGYFMVSNNNGTTLGPHKVMLWKTQAATTPAASPDILFVGASPPTDVPPMGLIANGSVPIKYELPISIALDENEQIFVAVWQDNNLSFCSEPQPQGRYWYTYDQTPPFSWASAVTDVYSAGIRAYGHTQSAIGCVEQPDACPATGPLQFCADLQADVYNCGACNHVCFAVEECVSGNCQCPTATPNLCTTGTLRCVDFQNDPNDCGNCGVVCDTNAGQVCSGGHCVCRTDPGHGECGGTCVDFARDPLHCGACDTPCAGGESCTPAEVCSCGGGVGFACGLSCVDVNDDLGNCGACNHVCVGTDVCVDQVCQPDPSGTLIALTSTTLPNLNAVATDELGHVFTADGTSLHMIDTKTQAVKALASGFVWPYAMVADHAGHLYVADYSAGRVRVVDVATGAVTVSADAGWQHAGPCGIAIGSDGNLYVSNYDSGTLQKVVVGSPTTKTTLVASGLGGPCGLTADASGNLYVAGYDDGTIRKVVIATGTVTVLAGNPGMSGHADGVGGAATFLGPNALAWDGAGALYVADGNPAVRKIAIATADVTTFIGDGTTNATALGPLPSTIKVPISVAISPSGGVVTAVVDRVLIAY